MIQWQRKQREAKKLYKWKSRQNEGNSIIQRRTHQMIIQYQMVNFGNKIRGDIVRVRKQCLYIYDYIYIYNIYL